MSVPQIRLKTKDFRAIANADIIIDGITVVAGENGSGKSTLSKLLYFVFKTACNYEKLVEKELREDLADVLRFLEAVVFDLSRFSDDKRQQQNSNDSVNKVGNTKPNFENAERGLQRIKRSKDFISEFGLGSWKVLVESVKSAYLETIQTQNDVSLFRLHTSRFLHILNELLGEDIKSDHFSSDLFDKVSDLVQALFENALVKINKRPVELFENAMSNIFTDSIGPSHFEVSELDIPIVKNGIDNLSKTYTVLNAIYTDTPMSIGIKDSGYDYWDDLNELLLSNPIENRYKYSVEIDNIINGEATFDIDIFSRKRFVFKRLDGAVFNLLDCATGIKSFAMLQILLNNGSLNDKTLLIIDEPEVHLHPKWIVEYARIIVKLNKEMGIKFFIASHDPDFISAIRYISEKEGNLDKVNFYLAEKAGETFTYNYTHLQHNIDPIFKSFNIAISKIEEYGA